MRIMVVDPAFEYSTLAVAESYFAAFKDLGYNVMEYDTLSAYNKYKPVFRDDDDSWFGLSEAVSAPILNHVIQDSIDFVLVIHGCHINPSIIASIRGLGVQTALILTDEPQQTDVSVKWSQFYDYVFSNDYNTVMRHKNCTFLPTAADENLFIPGTPPEEYRSDILFGGSWYPERKDFVCNEYIYERLKKYNVKCVGARRWDLPLHEPQSEWFGAKKMPIEEMAKYVRGAKICVDIPRDEFKCGVFGEANTFHIGASNLSPRIYEAGLSGSLVLTTDERKDIYRLFRNVTYPTYSTPEELCDHIDHYLKHDDEWLNLITKHYNYCNEEHTYKARVQTIAQIAGLQHSYGVTTNVGPSRRVEDTYGKQWGVNVTKLSQKALYCSENDISQLKDVKYNKSAILINNGPSIEATLGYCEYLAEQVDVSDIYVLNQTGTLLDSKEFDWGNLIVIHPTDDVYRRVYADLDLAKIQGRKLLTSTVVYHKVVTDWVDNDGDVYFFATGKQGVKKTVDAFYQHTNLSSGITVSWSALAILNELGYRTVHMFGYDFGYVDNKRYAYQDWMFWDLVKKNPTLMQSTFDKPVFTDRVLLKSLQACKEYVKEHPETTYITYGDGLFNDKDLINLRNVEC